MAFSPDMVHALSDMLVPKNEDDDSDSDIDDKVKQGRHFSVSLSCLTLGPGSVEIRKICNILVKFGISAIIINI